jgi:hypothetical protein
VPQPGGTAFEKTFSQKNSVYPLVASTVKIFLQFSSGPG